MIELLVSISIIGILAGIALVSFTGAQRQARDSERKSDLSQYQAYLETYANSNDGFYPIYTSPTSLVSVCNNDLNLSSCPEDQTMGQTYRYLSNVDGTKYVIWATLEGPGQYWASCSNGRVGQTATTSINGDCPVADVTSSPTPTYTNTPTNTPTPTLTLTPTPIAFPCLDGILNNGCFEADLANWTINGSGVSVVTTQFHTGLKALEIQTASGTRWARQTVNVVAGQNYTMSGWIKTALTTSTASINVIWRDSSGMPIWTTYVGSQAGTQDWTQHSTSFTAPTGSITAYILLGVTTGTGSTTWFDDVLLQ